MKRNRGLTTNELLISVATLVTVMGMAFAAFRGLGAVSASSSTRVRRASEVRWLFRRLDSVLPALTSHTISADGRRPFWGDEGGAVWEALFPRELGCPSHAPEVFSLQSRREEGKVYLARGTDEESLASGVEDFRLLYADEEGAFASSWGEPGDGCQDLPAFVLVLLKIDGKEYSHVVALGREE